MGEWTSLAEAHRVLTSFSNPYVGIITKEFEKLVDIDEARGFSYGTHVCDSRWLIGTASNKFNGGGARGRTQARLAGLGETVERYSAGYVSYLESDGFRFASAKQMRDRGENILGPSDIPLFAEEQYSDAKFPFQRWDPEARLWWYRGTDGATGEPVHAPAQLLFLTPPTSNEPRLGYGTSNGLAAGITPVEARISALLETIERDAVMLTWYDRLSMPRIPPTIDTAIASFFAESIDPAGLDVYMLDLSCFSDVPTVLGVVRNPHSDVAPLALGAAAALTLERACEKAVFECIYTRSWVKTEQRDGNVLETDNWAEDINSFDDHIRLYAGTKLLREADFLTANENTGGGGGVQDVADESPQIAWDALVGRLTRQGQRVCWFDMTSPDVVEGGASVMKVLVPGYCQLDAIYRGRWLGTPRFRERAHELGLIDHPLDWDELNHVPHPFP